MSENLSAAQKKLAETLKGIGIDLWGTDDPNKWAEKAFDESATEEVRKRLTGTEESRKRITGAEEGSPKETEAEKKPITIENLWITADESIDWTEALISDLPRDGLTPIGAWRFYHQQAERVLAGDIQAYVEVLKKMNPLGDLTDYVEGMVLRTPAPERLECEFQCRDDYLEQDARGYLGALSVRIARDLMATLPVEEVHIVGKKNGENRIDVTFRREQMLKRKMAFLVPADFAEECGGIIS